MIACKALKSSDMTQAVHTPAKKGCTDGQGLSQVNYKRSTNDHT